MSNKIGHYLAPKTLLKEIESREREKRLKREKMKNQIFPFFHLAWNAKFEGSAIFHFAPKSKRRDSIQFTVTNDCRYARPFVKWISCTVFGSNILHERLPWKLSLSRLYIFKNHFATILILSHRQLVVSIQTLSTIPPSTGQNKCYSNILLSCVYSQNVWPLWKSQMSCREKCCPSIYFAQ